MSEAVVVIGGGVGGLCAAARLAAAGRRPILVERRARVGGRASSFQRDGYTLNVGAVAIEYGGPLEETLREVGAALELRVPDPANVFLIRGRTINPTGGGWALLIDQLTRRGAKLLAGLSAARAGSYPGEQLTLAQWVSSATSNRTVARLFDNLAAAIFAARAQEIPARAFLTYFMEKGAFRRFGFHPRGTVAVCEQLAQAVRDHGGEVWTASEALALSAGDGRVNTVRVRRDDGCTVELECAAVISDIGPLETIELLDERALGSDYVAQIRARAQPTANFIIHLASDEPLLDAPGLVVFCETERICNAGNLTATCPELAPPGRHLTVVYAVPRPATGAIDVELELARSIQELARALPGAAQAQIVDARAMHGRWPAQRALAGHELPRRTPLANLWHVGDGVRAYAAAGTQACAESARDVVAQLLEEL